MPDWSDTVSDRENAEVNGFVGSDETVDNADDVANKIKAAQSDDTPVEDVRRDAIAETEAAGVDVAEPPAENPQPAKPSTDEPGVGGPADNGEPNGEGDNGEPNGNSGGSHFTDQH